MAGVVPKTLDLALQGGGAHGALTWGVLDRLLEDERLHMLAVSGTSAGAMNAVVMADGHEKSGREGARAALRAFWVAVSEAARYSPLQRTFWDRLSGTFTFERSPWFQWLDQLTRFWAPSQLNPLDLNPLRDLLAQTIDFERVNACRALDVYVTATNVRTGRARVFGPGELSVDSVMASAALPQLFRPVEIAGEVYWDGGYIGNPALYPLVDNPGCRDILIVQINPLRRDEVPVSAHDIADRINEITFNASLVKELRSIHLLHHAIDALGDETQRHRDVRLHLLHPGDGLDATGKVYADWAYLERLFESGRLRADAWLEQHFDDLGQRSSLDLDDLFSDTFQPPVRDCG